MSCLLAYARVYFLHAVPLINIFSFHTDDHVTRIWLSDTIIARGDGEPVPVVVGTGSMLCFFDHKNMQLLQMLPQYPF